MNPTRAYFWWTSGLRKDEPRFTHSNSDEVCRRSRTLLGSVRLRPGQKTRRIQWSTCRFPVRVETPREACRLFYTRTWAFRDCSACDVHATRRRMFKLDNGRRCLRAVAEMNRVARARHRSSRNANATKCSRNPLVSRFFLEIFACAMTVQFWTWGGDAFCSADRFKPQKPRW